MSRICHFFHTLLIVALVMKNVPVEGIGVNWGTVTSHHLAYKTVIQMLKDNGIGKVKFFEAEPDILKALAGSGLEVMIGMGNPVLQGMASDYKKAQAWVKQNVTAYNPTSPSGVNITMVGVGNEPFLKDYKDMFINSTYPALVNMQKALDEAKLSHIKATIPFNGDVYYSPSWNPVPSAGLFRPDIKDEVVKIVEQLDKNQAPFMVNIYPFLSLYYGNGSFPFDYAFFDGVSNPLTDNGIKYTNVFDANLDTLVSALKAEGYGNMSIVVGEMGWPTDGYVFANASTASRFYNGLTRKIASNKGTPLRPGNTEIYFFGLFDEDEKSILPGNFERHWGIFAYDGQPKFHLDLSGGKNNKTLVPAKGVEYLASKWCTLKGGASNNKKIEEAMKYACDRADCTPLSNDSSCSFLDADGQASYAFNAFFQTADQSPDTCDFQGLATLTTKNISQGSCNFTIQIVSAESATAPVPSPSESPADGGSNPSSPGGSKSSPDSSSSSAPPSQVTAATHFLSAMTGAISLLLIV